MKKMRGQDQPHLSVREFSIPAGGEWSPQPIGWLLVQIGVGTGYCLRPDSNHELEAGAVLLLAGGAQATLRASHLAELSLCSFSVVPRYLSGLMSLNEQAFFQTAASKKEFCFQLFPAQHPLAVAMKETCATRDRVVLRFRLKLLEVFMEAFGDCPDQPPPGGGVSEARERLRLVLKEMPSSELLEMSLDELARRTHCTPRHLSRIFRELVGVSFREERREARLSRARELLANGNSKVVDVALESGYTSLSLFNLAFSRRFGTSPGKWRQKHGRKWR